MDPGRDDEGVSAEKELLLLLLFPPLPLVDFCDCKSDGRDLEEDGLPSSRAVFRIRLFAAAVAPAPPPAAAVPAGTT